MYKSVRSTWIVRIVLAVGNYQYPSSSLAIAQCWKIRPVQYHGAYNKSEILYLFVTSCASDYAKKSLQE